MSTLFELAEQINLLYPLQDKSLGKRYRIVDQMAGTTELEEANGKPRYIPTKALNNPELWQLSHA
ncbi:hypothetical protein [Thiopseudomonas alkaliphila]|uniref:Uncharacterized protein n=1 Tax=Thiopseudomonas alkaliphila TaxID=1697053 RepID=A0AAW7DUB8_9GAMM|nr:hypothetical protein [Thiopseudomonas alkaliphila]MDM1696027.1 hypothetical protein [Thiopseudomonas alkaliphila]MDM1708464.1 hypothetical protein [Thiopseudomonas alkaliphila]MDM1716580.1 hypothetical protein [Thiopseudomonas alkaliphila]